MLHRPLDNETTNRTWRYLKTRPLFREYSLKIASAFNLVDRNIFKCISGANAGKSFIVVGGVDSGNTLRWYYYDLSAVVGGALTALYNVASASTSSPWSVLYNQFIYMGDGYSDNRKWDGNTLTNIGAAHPRCLTAATHKSRLILANDITNTAPNRLWISDVGTDTIQSTSFIDVGPSSESIIQVVDAIDKLIIVKESSTWFIYLAANLIDSQKFLVDPQKGAQNKRCISPYGSGFICVSERRGLELFVNEYSPLPSSLEIYKEAATILSVYSYGDLVYLCTGGELYVYDIINKTNTVHLCDGAVIHNIVYAPPKQGLLGTYADPGSGFPALLSLFSDIIPGIGLDPAIPAAYTTKLFTFGDVSRYKSINRVILGINSLSSNSVVVCTAVCDGVGAQVLTAPTSGASFLEFKFNPNVVKGREISFSFSNNVGNFSSYAFREMWIHYNIEDRIGS